MIPILYGANETDFTSQGLGALVDAISVYVSRVVNGKDELTMVYPSDSIRYADLANDRIIYAQPEYRKSAQPYQIYKITRPMNGRATVYARHVGSHRPQFIPVTQFAAGSLAETFNKIPLNAAETCPFTFWTNKTVTANFKLEKPATLGKVLGGMSGSILDVYGGEYEFDGYTIKLLNRRGVDSGVELRYAKNITDIEQSEDFSGIVTGVVPYWEGMDGTVVTLPEVVIEGTNADVYSFRRTVIKDFSEKFQDQPTEAELRAAAQAYVAQSGIGAPELNLKVSFEHLAQYTGYENLQLLETLNLGDTVSILYEPLNITATARIVKTTYDCLNEKYTSVQIGSVKSDLEQVMSQAAKEVSQVKSAITQGIPSAIDAAVEHATDLITGVDGGYYIVNKDANGHPYETLWMDTDDKTTATYVIRINKNGVGFSTSGYNGPYINAWTIDGQFVADFITAGTLNAIVIRAGLLTDALGKNSWNLDTGVFSITDGKIVATFTRTFNHSDYSSTDLTTIYSLITSGVWTDDDLEKYDINLDGQITSADLVKVRNMVNDGTDETVSIKTEIDPSQSNRPIAIYNGSTLKASISPSNVYAQSGTFEKKVFGGDSWLGGNGVLELNGSYGHVYAQAGDGITFYDASNTQTGRIGSDCKDYIKEQGTSGVWNYRRWNSGKYECWTTIAPASKTFSAWGSGYYSPAMGGLAYPVTFASAPHEIPSPVPGYAWYSILSDETANTTTTSGKYRAYRPTSGAAIVGLRLYVIGSV